jgi:phosphate/sulfate permease
MEFYLFVLIVLFATAIVDLTVGVANDAVNFLNSAVGSRAGKRVTIMLVASAGVLIGTTFSGGIMEVARKGIFNPEMFVFHEVMIIFLAVMLTDIILLDVYNTFALPTSTTVSIVFELLGGAFAISVVKVWGTDGGLGEVLAHINTANVLTIVSSIGLSIVFAFIFGSAMQFLTRLIFTFDYLKTFRRYGGLYCGFAISMITYFILVKGAKGSTLISPENAAWIKENMTAILLASFVVWSVFWQAVILWTRINVLRIIVLIGTFALALAFAANDLVNFIGAPMGALAAYLVAGATPGVNPDTLTMEALARTVQVNTWFLLLAGAIMAATLWLSRKARSVTMTEVSLGRQLEGVERFGSSVVSRAVVGMALSLYDVYSHVVPQSLRGWISGRMDPTASVLERDADGTPPAFDLLRAAVNLMVASALISFGTSLKLPLSTTFVTFMVAMSTSLVDKAWGRESAVYRVNGVITVVGGWFFTGLLAFSACFVLALVIHFGGLVAILGIIVLAVILLRRTAHIHRSREEDLERRERERRFIPGEAGRLAKLMQRVGSIMESARAAIDLTIEGLIKERRKPIREAIQLSETITNEVELVVHGLLNITRESEDESSLLSRYGQKIAALQILAANVDSLTGTALRHLENHHKGPDKLQAEDLRRVQESVMDLMQRAHGSIGQANDGDIEALTQGVSTLKDSIRQSDRQQIKRIKGGKAGTRQSLLFLGTMSKTERIVEQAVLLSRLYRETIRNLRD